MQTTYKVCPMCHKKALSTTPKCLECGFQYGAVPAVKPSQEPTVSMPPPQFLQGGEIPLLDFGTCLHCGGKDIQTVSAVFRAGTSSSISMGVGAARIGIGAGVGLNNTSTNLATLCAPPSMPVRSVTFAGCWILPCGFFGAFSGMYALLAPDGPHIGAMSFFVICITGILGARMAVKQFKEDEVNRMAYETERCVRLTSNWDRLTYCRRCDYVSHLGKRVCVPVVQIQTLLG